MFTKNNQTRLKKSALDLTFLSSCAVLIIFGLVMIYDASVVAAFRDFGDRLYYFKNQLIWVTLGTFMMLAASFVDYHKFTRNSLVFLAIVFLLLIVVLIPQLGSEIYGARRWITLGTFNFQPSEFAKLALIFYQARILAKFQNYSMRLTDTFVVFFLPAIILTGLVIVEPDLGTALVLIAITLITYFSAKAPLTHFLLAIPGVILAAVGAILLEPYRVSRLKSYLDPTFDPQGASYQINQILIAIKNGGLLGVGIGGSRGKFDFIPEVHSDAIFSVVVEELGLVGAIFLIILILFLSTKIIDIAKEAKDMEGKIIASGILAIISVQAFLNLASNVALVPLVGIPLPFISYGGSSFIITMIALGILINIKKQS